MRFTSSIGAGDGLRAQEAAHSCQSLKTRDKQQEKGSERLPVIFDT